MRHRLLLICASERTGSGFLCWLMAATRRMGDPREYYSMQEPRHRNLDKHGPAFLEALARRTATPNGVFGIKAMLGCLGRFGVLDHWGEIQARFAPQVVWLRRRDKLRQAISRYRAVLTGEWHRRCGARPPETVLPFNSVRIWKDHDRFVANERFWPPQFQRMGVNPLEVWYEDLIVDPQAVVNRICRSMGVAAPAVDLRRCPIAVQRDEPTELWVRRLTGGMVGSSQSYVDWASEG